MVKLLPCSFYILLPVAVSLFFSLGVGSCFLVLQALDLARSEPEQVWLMPLVLRCVSPEAFSGLMLGISSLGGGLVGSAAGKLADRLGMKACCITSVAIQVVGQALFTFRRTFIIGQLLITIGSGASLPLFTALFSSQFEDEETTTTLITYMYAVGNAAFTASTIVGGLHPFWLCSLEATLLLSISLVILLVASPSLVERAETAACATVKNDRQDRARLKGFAVLCVFTLLFFAIFLQFLGGPFMVFARDAVAPLRGRKIPPAWFLSLNGLFDLLVSVPLAWLYESVGGVRFHVKFRVCFFMLCMASAILALTSRLTPTAVSPFALAASMLLVSIGELHYNPVMLATISTEMPASHTGLFTGIHYLLGGVGGLFAGSGVPVYHAVGAGTFYALLAVVSLLGAAGMQLVSPFLMHWFDCADDAKLPLLAPKAAKK